MSIKITPEQKLYVVSETSCRGDIERSKFTIKFKFVQHAYDQFNNSDPVEEFENWLETFHEDRAGLLSLIQSDPSDNHNLDLIESLLSNGQVGMMGEETNYGISTTKDGAIQAFYVMSGPITYDNWC